MRPLILVVVLAALLSGCATPELEAPDALRGKELQNAEVLFGPWHDRLNVKGKTVYIWRRSVTQDGVVQGCELWVEMGFRGAIARSSLRGYPAACSLFRVIYEPDHR